MTQLLQMTAEVMTDFNESATYKQLLDRGFCIPAPFLEM